MVWSCKNSEKLSHISNRKDTAQQKRTGRPTKLRVAAIKKAINNTITECSYDPKKRNRSYSRNICYKPMDRYIGTCVP